MARLLAYLDHDGFDLSLSFRAHVSCLPARRSLSMCNPQYICRARFGVIRVSIRSDTIRRAADKCAVSIDRNVRRQSRGTDTRETGKVCSLSLSHTVQQAEQ